MSENKKCFLLKEFADFEYRRETEEDGKPKKSKWGNMMVKGILQRADALNQNGRIYPRAVLQKEMENYNKLISERRALGELDHADQPVVNLKHVSHVITETWWEGNDVWGRVEVLEDMDEGRQLKVLFQNDIKVGISSRGLGSLVERGDNLIVQDDLQLVCWDFVSEPSTHNAFMMKEAREVKPEELERLYSKSDKIDRIANEILGIKEYNMNGTKKY